MLAWDESKASARREERALEGFVDEGLEGGVKGLFLAEPLLATEEDRCIGKPYQREVL